LKGEIQPLLTAFDIQLHTPHSRRWYWHLPNESGLTTYPPYALLGKNITHYLPTGPQQKAWRRLLTEIQMQLHQSSVNTHRQAQNQAPVNGLWLWGEGQPPPRSPAKPISYVASNEVIALGLAKHFGLPHQNLPSSFAAMEMDKSNENEAMIVDDRLLHHYLYGDLPSWRQHVEFLDQHWFCPLWHALMQRRIEQIHLYAKEHDVFTIAPNTLQRWWRRVIQR
jgi:hypothetical protein